MRRGLLATREELAGLKDRVARKPFDRIYDALVRRCSLILESSPITEAAWRMAWQRGQFGSALQAVRTAQGRILDLLIAHHIDPNTAYRDRAIEELKDLVGWQSWVDPVHSDMEADLCTAEAAVAATVGLDWLWEDLTEVDRLRVLQALRHKAVDAYKRAAESQSFWYNCYHNWNAVVNSGCGLAALALSDDEPVAMEAYRLARKGLQRFFDALGREGGWDEGTGYWGYATRYVLLFGEAVYRLFDDQAIVHSRGMDATGLFPVYFTPNGKAASFGDYPAVPLHGTFYLLVKHFGQRELTWWLDTYSFHRDVSSDGWSAAGLAMLFRPIDADSGGKLNLQPMKIFHEIGWAAIGDIWPKPSFYVAAKTGDLSANHAQRDMNSIQLQLGGEMLLTDLGHAPYSSEYFGSRTRSEFYEVQARAHNTICVAGRDHRLDAQGSIVEAQCGKNYRWLACDAGQACGENVHFVRHLVMIVNPATQGGRMLIVLDELINLLAEKIDLFWHSQGKISVSAKTGRGTITGASAALQFALASTSKFTAKVRSEPIRSPHTDHMLRVSTGPVEAALLLTVFSREKLPAKLVLKQSNAGEVRVYVGDVALHFRRLKRHLQLDKVVTV